MTVRTATTTGEGRVALADNRLALVQAAKRLPGYGIGAIHYDEWIDHAAALDLLERRGLPVLSECRGAAVGTLRALAIRCGPVCQEGLATVAAAHEVPGSGGIVVAHVWHIRMTPT